MRADIRLRVVIAILLLASVGLSAQTAAPPAAPPSLSRAEMEDFLQNAKIVKTRPAGKGITNSLRATLSDGRITHDAHIQKVDISKMEFKGNRGTELNFKDSYRFNIAAYELDKLINLNLIPATVERKIGTDPASVTWWVDDVLMDEGERLKKKTVAPNMSAFNAQIHLMRVFDQLIYNTDRNLGNLIWQTDWKMVLIDHSRAFRLSQKLLPPVMLEKCERTLLTKLRDLDQEKVNQALGKYITKDEIKALIARRDEIVKLFDTEVAKKGEPTVLYSLSIK